MKWSVEQRLEFIEFRLFWDGQLNRSDLTERFGISVPQASLDLARYQNMAPRNLHYDGRLKTYVAARPFEPVISKPTARYYLSQLRLLADGALEQDATWLGWLPAFAVVPLIRRRLDSRKLRSVLRAIRESRAMCVKYQSFSRAAPTLRWLMPHALVFDGFRWHVRAWCHEHKSFRDFVLARFLGIVETKPDHIDPAADRAWNSEITFRLGPHPEMVEAQRRAIELDFGMVNGVVEVTTRACLSYYLERQLGLDLDPAKVPPQRQQLVLLNRGEVEAILRALNSQDSKTLQPSRI